MAENQTYLARRMKTKLSIYKCSNCEKQAKRGLIVPYLFHKVKRGQKCPNCNCSTIRKISISAVMQLRWKRTVKPYLTALRSTPHT